MPAATGGHRRARRAFSSPDIAAWKPVRRIHSRFRAGSAAISRSPGIRISPTGAALTASSPARTRPLSSSNRPACSASCSSRGPEEAQRSRFRALRPPTDRISHTQPESPPPARARRRSVIRQSTCRQVTAPVNRRPGRDSHLQRLTLVGRSPAPKARTAGTPTIAVDCRRRSI